MTGKFNVNAETEYFTLLKTWLDALLKYALDEPEHPTLDGAILCPACSMIHGRCHDAVYPLLYMAERTGESRYLDAAKKLFRWAEYMVCDDGSVYNDSQSEWCGVTVFAALSYVKALKFHGQLLGAEERKSWEDRLLRMTKWLKRSISASTRTNVNYLASNAAYLAQAAEYFGDASLLDSARELAREVLSHVSGNGLIAGEGGWADAVTAKGVRPVDMGYNAEETLPSLYEYALAAKDDAAMAEVRRIARAQLEFYLPDGALDNSMGTRNYKWTYWGSRTSDGCQALYNALGKTEPAFAEAAYRNLELLKRCTDGLLYGGPHYKRHGEYPCVHHAFCHAKVLAQALDEGIAPFERTALPSDAPLPVRHYPELGTYRLAQGDWRMDVCGSDLISTKGGQVTGGTVTLLWNRTYGPVFAVATTDYTLREPHNQQLSRKKRLQGAVHPRLEVSVGETVYSQAFDLNARMAAEERDGMSILRAEGVLCDKARSPLAGSGFSLEYALSDKSLLIRGSLNGEWARLARFVLPVILKTGQSVTLENDTATIDGLLKVSSETPLRDNGQVFCLTPGFEAEELWVQPDPSGHFGLRLEIAGTE